MRSAAFVLLWNYAEAANHSAFFVSVMPVGDIQFTEYHGGEGGFYDPHIDVNWCNTERPYDRKLSITVQLSEPAEYEGGDFSFSNVENPDLEAMRKKGSVLVFPSYLTHGVSPVTKGSAKASSVGLKETAGASATCQHDFSGVGASSPGHGSVKPYQLFLSQTKPASCCVFGIAPLCPKASSGRFRPH